MSIRPELALLGISFGVLLGPRAGAQVPIFELTGLAGSRTGEVIASMPDIDGNGFDELLIGAPDDSWGAPGAGRVFLLSGPVGGVQKTWFGTDDYARFGAAVACAGDVNLDGVADVIVGEPLGGFGRPGLAYVFSGYSGQLLHTLFGPGMAVEGFGSSVAGAGDVNGDGHDDVVVGAPGSLLSSPGSASVYSGADGALLHRFYGTSNSRLGASVAGAGDLDGDGFDDILVGTPQWGVQPRLWVGSVSAYSGRDGTLLYRVEGTSAMDRLGTAVASVGDLDGDGIQDVLAGAPQTSTIGSAVGMVSVLSGATGQLIRTLHGNPGYELFGSALSGAGDLDLDGVDDLIVGVGDTPANAGLRAGRVRLISGASGHLLHELDAPLSGDGFGLALAEIGDLDGDGVPEVIVGDPLASGSGAASGRVRVYSGSDLRPGRPLCAGAIGAGCPCGNPTANGSGCANGTGSGAHLAAFGVPDISLDVVVLRAGGIPPLMPGIFLGGRPRTTGLPLGNGLLCLRGGQTRLEVIRADGSGQAVSSTSLSQAEGLGGGEVRGYQLVYRDSMASGACTATFNVSSGVVLTW